MVAWHKWDLEERMYCNLKDEKKISMPRYYKDKMYIDVEREIIKAACMEKQTIAFWKKIEEFEKNPILSKSKWAGIDAANKKMALDSTKGKI